MGYDFFRGEEQRPEHLERVEEKEAGKVDYRDMDEAPDILGASLKEKDSQESKGEESPEKKAEVDVSPEKEVESPENGEKESVKADQEAQDKAIKMLTALNGEEELKIPTTAKFKIKSDKEEIEASLQDLVNEYSGAKAVQKRFTELDKEKKEWEKDWAQVDEFVNEFAAASKESKLGGIYKMAELLGVDPLEYKRALREEMVREFAPYYNMEEDQRIAFDRDEELSYLKSQRELEQKRVQEQQAQRELYNRFLEVQQTHAIDDQRFDMLVGELQNTYNQPVTPENVAILHNSMQRLDKVGSVLNRVNPEYANDESKFNQLDALLRGNPQMDESDLENIARKLWASPVEQAAKELEKRAPKPGKQIKTHDYKPTLKMNGNNFNIFD